MDLHDFAEADHDAEYRTAAESHGVYRLLETELTDCDELTPEDAFPVYGLWVRVERLTRTGKPNGEAWLEAPQGFARALADADCLAVDHPFTVENVAKDRDGRWTYQVVPGVPANDKSGDGDDPDS